MCPTTRICFCWQHFYHRMCGVFHKNKQFSISLDTQTRCLTTYFSSDPNYLTTWRFNLCIRSHKFKSLLFNLKIAPLQMPGAIPGLLYFRPYYKSGVPTTVSLPLLERLTEKFRKTVYLLLPFIIKDTSQKQANGRCIRQGMGGRDGAS